MFFTSDNSASLNLASGWHALAIERQDGVMRFFVDDFFLGRVSVPRDVGLKGILLSMSFYFQMSMAMCGCCPWCTRMPSGAGKQTI